MGLCIMLKPHSVLYCLRVAGSVQTRHRVFLQPGQLKEHTGFEHLTLAAAAR